MVFKKCAFEKELKCFGGFLYINLGCREFAVLRCKQALSGFLFGRIKTLCHCDVLSHIDPGYMSFYEFLVLIAKKWYDFRTNGAQF